MNSILDSLPPSEFKLLKADLDPAELSKGEVLFEPDRRCDYVYFPSDGVISFLGDTGEGGSVEVWSVGNEGVAGLSAVGASMSRSNTAPAPSESPTARIQTTLAPTRASTLES